MNDLDQSLESRLSDTFLAVAGQTPVEDRWEQLVADLNSANLDSPNLDSADRLGGTERSSAGGDRTRYRPRFGAGPRQQFLLVAASVVALIGFGGFLVFSSAPTVNTTALGSDAGYVLPGETTLGTDPLIVQGASGAEPAFDTSTLGTEVVLEPADDVADDILDLIDRERRSSPGGDVEVVKVTVAGRADGNVWLTVATDRPNHEGLGGEPETANVRTRSLLSPNAGSGSSDVVATDSMDMITPPDIDDLKRHGGPGYETPSGPVTLSPLPDAVSVVTFQDADTRLWVRPRGGVAVFPEAQFTDGEMFTVAALDANGEIMASWTISAEVDSVETRSADSPPFPVGTSLGPIVGFDDDERPVGLGPEADADVGASAESGSRLTALILGAAWCPPCEEGLMEEVAVITDLVPDIEIYAVPHMSDADGIGGIWPSDAVDWPHSRLRVEPGTVLDNVEGIPTVIILDADNTVVASWVGFGQAGAHLAELNPN